MSDLESTNFSETAASNNAATPNGWPEGQAPSTVNDCARELMGALKREWDRSGPTVTSGGSANAQTLTYTAAVAALVRGQKYSFIAGFTNTGATTLAVSGLTATAVRLNNAALVGGEIVVGLSYSVVYDGTAYQLMAGYFGVLTVKRQVITSTGTYTPSAGMIFADVEVVGGGGGGGGVPVSAGGTNSAGGAGGAGGYTRGLLTAATIGASQAVTITAGGGGGAAGANPGATGGVVTFGAILTTNGGAGGAAGAAAAALSATIGGLGGASGSGGNLNLAGNPGNSSWASSGTISVGGNGGNSFYGQGGRGNVPGAGSALAGNAAIGFGAGGSGGLSVGVASTAAGGNGGNGVVVVTEYCTQ